MQVTASALDNLRQLSIQGENTVWIQQCVYNLQGNRIDSECFILPRIAINSVFAQV